MNIKCCICKNDSEFLLSKDSYDFYECLFCKLIFVSPLPSHEELKKVYSPFFKYQSHKINKDYTKNKNYKYEKIFNELKKFRLVEGSVLDVGTSDGDFLFLAKKLGFSVAGVEPNKTTADIANSYGLNVFNGFLNDSSFERGSFQVLRLGDVLEHSNDPNKLLKDCAEFLAPGGFLVISIPNMDSFWARSTRFWTNIFNLPWSVLTPPHHLFYFSRSNLDMIFKNNGFEFVTDWYFRPPTFKYEFGNTHLFGSWKRDRSINNLWRLVFGLILYIKLYLIDVLLSPFKSRDFSMMCIYKKDA